MLPLGAVTVVVAILLQGRAAAGEFRLDTENGGITVYRGDAVVLRVAPAAPVPVAVNAAPDAVTITGSSGEAAFALYGAAGSGVVIAARFTAAAAFTTESCLLITDSAAVVEGEGRVPPAGGVRLVVMGPWQRNAGGIEVRPGGVHPGDPDRTRLIWFGIVPAGAALPLVTMTPALPSAAVRNEAVTMACDIIDVMTTPYTYRAVRCTVSDPDGRSITIEPFFYEPHLRQDEGWMPVGRPQFAFRFTPRKTGPHRVRVESGGKVLYEAALAVTGGQGQGFLRRPQKERFLTDDTGAVFFPVGINAAWGNTDHDLAWYLDRMAESGINFARVWLCTWDLALEGRRLDDYRQDTAARLDDLFERAQARGIRLMLCVNNFYDFVNHRDRTGWFAPGGPVAADGAFFTDGAWLARRQDFYRFLVNRYAAWPSLAAWELWNEIDYAAPANTNIAAAEERMAAFLHTIDPYGRPVTTSLGVGRVDYQLWDKPGIDIVQYHLYVPAHDLLAPGSVYHEPALLISGAAGILAGFGKPVLLGEFGHHGTNEANPNNDLDPEGILLHETLWASALGGFAGSGLPWWWDVYVDRNNLWYHFKPLALVMGRAYLSMAMRPVSADAAEGRARVMALRDDRSAVVWIADRRATWSGMLIDRYTPVTIPATRIDLAGFRPGEYAVAWFNTFSGEAVGSARVAVAENSLLLLEVPAFTRDLAGVIGTVVQ
ncbi:MAG: cellulase family glycosylhydrolase [Planctomycetota bacterium]